MSRTYIILISVAAATLLTVAAIWNIEKNKPQTLETKTYTSAVHGFSLSYPSSLSVREYLPENIVFGISDGETMEGVVEARVITMAGTPGQTFIEAIAEQLKMLCAADGPTGTFSCTGIESIQPFVTTANEQGHTLYLNGALTIFATNQTTSVQKGPYVILPLETTAMTDTVLVIHPPLNQNTAEANLSTIDSVAKSVVFTNASGENPVVRYVRDYISRLSPEKEVLGGTFFVTDISVENGKGLVEYEDGHILLFAEFTYTLDAQNNVAITSFEIKE